ncbi:MAG TPA: ATP-binding protein [Sphingomicrobium sp.]|nr:ATP-binding protein [Sphingomicrobium sp.]
MRSIGARLTLGYALSATISFAILSVIGGRFLEGRLTDGLDELNASEFRQLQAHIGSDYASASPTLLEKRLANVNSYESVLFYISIENPRTHVKLFNSQNLRGRPIPDVKGKRKFDGDGQTLGPLRIDEFLLPPYDVTVATSARNVSTAMREYTLTSLALILGMLLASTAIGLGMSQVVLGPIRTIRETADRIRSDNLSERIPVGDVRDELSELAQLLNRTFDRLERTFIQMRRFSEEVSHELKTPLSLLRLHAEQILRDDKAVHEDAAVEQIEEIARLNRFIDQMLFLSQAEADSIALDLKSTDPKAFIEAFAADAAVLAEDSGHLFSSNIEGRGLIALDEGHLRQVLFNITANALKVTPKGGRIRLGSSFRNSAWRLVLQDDGPGVPACERERMFDRFVRLGDPNPTTRGAGLGLTISRSIVRLHGGRIWAQPAPDLGGLAIIVELPCVQEAPPGKHTLVEIGTSRETA